MRGASRAGHRRRRRRSRSARIAIATGSALVAALVLAAGASVVQAVTAPGTDDASVKLAEWARDHGMGAAVTAIEDVQYRLHPPVTGGTPDLAVLADAAAAAATDAGSAPVPPVALGGRGSSQHIASAVTAAVPLHPPMPTPVRPALRGEGVFNPMGPGSQRRDVQIAFVRPDRVHTSYLTGVAWMSKDDRFVLHPGYQDPGNLPQWSEPDTITRSATAGLIATFNGGFKLKDARGGYYDHGAGAASLVKGAASLVIYDDGHATVGTWGSDVRMGPTVAFVRQNLKPLIEHGVVARNLAANVESTWGATVGGDLAVWRSGLGVTADGDLVYAMGDALTVQALADVLQKAGAVTAMQLDINRAWTSFMTYGGQAPSTPRKMGSFERPANRYLQPTSRDFVAVYAPRAA